MLIFVLQVIWRDSWSERSLLELPQMLLSKAPEEEEKEEEGEGDKKDGSKKRQRKISGGEELIR